MSSLDLIKRKLAQTGIRGLSAGTLRQVARVIERYPKAGANNTHYHHHQTSAHRALSRYASFEGKDILEVGGAQCCESIYPFLREGAASATVTGLDHIEEEQSSGEYNLRILKADALKLSNTFKPCSFDAIYGLSIIEHIPTPDVFINEIYTILKPGGLAYLEGNPIWSSPRGHHLWVATWCGEYQNKATANYLFNGWEGKESTNPLPDWAHLLMTPSQMREHLEQKKIPATDIECIIDWVFQSDNINRIDMTTIAKAYTRSKLSVLQANTTRSDVPSEIQAALRKKFGDGIDYGIEGVTYILAKI